tara:strand:+ start:1606 stop:1785 length:180 start_codon:yes stop_codon:yes gene_type:complete
MDDKTNLEIRKFLKRLGINSQEKLIEFIKNNPDINKFSISVNFEINGNQSFDFKDTIQT